MVYSPTYNLQRVMVIFECGYMFHHIGTALLIYKLQSQKSMYGICIDTHICYMFALIARCFWQFDTQLASMSLTYIEITIALLSQSILIYQCYQYKDILYKQIQQVYLRWYSIVAICLVLSCLFHPGKKGAFFFTF